MKKFPFKKGKRDAKPAKDPSLSLRYLQISPLATILLSGLAVIASSAALFALYALFGPTGAEDSATVPEWKPPTLAIAPLDPPKPATLDIESLSRPIFSKSRKPAPKTAATSSANIAAAPVALSVKAIMRSKKSVQAFLISSETPGGSWLKIGDTVDNWKITAIAPKEVILQSGGQTTKLQLYADPPAAAAVSATPPQGNPPTAPNPQQ